MIDPMDAAHIHMDDETFSEIDLTKVGVYKYAEHHSTDVLLASWFSPDLVQHNRPAWWRPGDSYPFAQWHDRLGKDVFIVAWNSQFERIMWWKVLCKRYGWPKPPLEAFICASAWARGTAAAPAKLELAGQFFAQSSQKDMAGHRLMLQMCKPATEAQQLKFLARVNDHGVDSLHDWEYDLVKDLGLTDAAKRCHHSFKSLDSLHYYCDDDTLTEYDITKILPYWPREEVEAFWESERINDEGIPVDHAFACAAAEFAEEEKAELNAELSEITKGHVTTPRQFVKFKEWALPRMSPEAVKLTEYYEKGVKKNSFDANVRHNLLMALQDDPDLVESQVWDAIEILDEAGKSTIAKYQAIVNMAITPPDGGTPRVHGLYMYAGAAQSGRYSGIKVQPHNLVRDVPKIAPQLIDAFNARRRNEIQKLVNKWADDVNAKKASGEKLVMNSPVHALGGLVRPCITVITTDHDKEWIVWCDWSSIEAILLPWQTIDADAEGILGRYRRGEDLYIPVASSILNKPASQITKFERQAYGKVPQLSLGFLGGEGALTAMAKNYGVKFTDREKKRVVRAWRRANPWAMRFGEALDYAAKWALKRPNVGYSAGRIEYIYEPRDLGGMGALYAILPSGRALCYPDPDIEMIKKPWGMTECITARKGSWRPAKDAKDWPRVGVWKGLLAENPTQALNADLLNIALMRAREPAFNLRVIGHTHDEIFIRSKKPEKDAQTLRRLMEMSPPWRGADSLPIRAEVEWGPRYKVKAA